MGYVYRCLGLLGIIGCCFFFVFASLDVPESVEKDVENAQVMGEKPVNDYKVYAIPMPDDLNFAGEKVPIDDPDIRARMDRELLVNTYWQSNGFLLFKRANKYFPIIEPILAEHGVPDDLKYLAVIESGLVQAVSPAGASGFWQIMKATGREYGLEVNENVDERFNIEKSTHVACKYLKKAHAKFNSWALAAAAYNAGSYGISKKMEAQKVTSYYNLYLREETGRYVFRILALKEILKNPKKYGFNYGNDDLYKPIETYKVAVEKPIASLPDFAKEQGVNYKILRIHNPWLKQKHLNNRSAKLYHFVIPKTGQYKTLDL